MKNLITTESREGVTIYGEVINNFGKFGKFQVYSAYSKSETYTTYADAEKKMSAMIGVKNI